MDFASMIGIHKEGIVELDNKHAGNPHIAITGRSGFGKSVAGHNLLLEVMRKGGGSAVVFDVHRLFSKENIVEEFQEELRIRMNELSVYENGISVPLFTPFQFSDGGCEDRLDVLSAVTGVFAGAMKLGSRQKALLYEAVDFVAEQGTFHDIGIAAMDKAFAALDNEQAIAIRSRLSYLLKRNIFRDGDSFIKDGFINVLRLSRLPPVEQDLIVEVVLNFIWRSANAGLFMEKPLCLFLDECQGLKWGKSGIISSIMSEGRKMGLQLILITQSLEGNSRSDMAKCFSQAASRLYFSPAENEASMIAKKIASNRSAYWQLQLKSLDRGECVVDGPLLLNGVPCMGPLKIKIEVIGKK